MRELSRLFQKVPRQSGFSDLSTLGHVLEKWVSLNIGESFQSGAIGNHERRSLDGHQMPELEIAQGARNGLARGADECRNFFVREGYRRRESRRDKGLARNLVSLANAGLLRH